MLPSRVVLYDVFRERVRAFLDKGSYEKCGEFFHTHLPEGRTGGSVEVYCREGECSATASLGQD